MNRVDVGVCLLGIKQTIRQKDQIQLRAWLRHILGTLQEKIPHRWGNTRTLKCTISNVPSSARDPSLGRADDKCIRAQWEREIGCVTDDEEERQGEIIVSRALQMSNF